MSDEQREGFVARHRSEMDDLRRMHGGTKTTLVSLAEARGKATPIVWNAAAISVLSELIEARDGQDTSAIVVLADADKVAMDASPLPELAEKLVAIFESQIAGGKRYDLAAMGRRVANATFFASHATDTTHALSFAMDLTPLVQDDALSVADFTLRHLENLRADVAGRLGKMT